jgi:transcription elongation GreA/GreB family factor
LQLLAGAVSRVLWQQKDSGKLRALDQSCAAAIRWYRNKVTAQRLIQMEAEFDLYHAGPKIRAACARMRQFPMPSIRSPNLSVAFTKEESAETASETLLPDRPISPHPNLVTEQGLKALEFQLQRAREAYEAVQRIEDVNERRREAAIPVRDIRYFSERMRTAQVVADPASCDVVAFGSTVTFSRSDGRVQKFRIVGEDEADPKGGSISFASPAAKSLMGKVVGDVVGSGSQEFEIVAIS